MVMAVVEVPVEAIVIMKMMIIAREAATAEVLQVVVHVEVLAP